ncbi:tricarballylate utilization 4Fe-4S protein TcuB [Rhodocyclus tenuis]|uniref:Citrate/tricarballylate utilization protein n=1 Tax=Rhodocyclus tenuis TaxID=1066 RepID=A0A840GC74_RHOTE|nr:tricarballylate utilization 4Fe-4S protein TcuB [Rhodocyclus tenuis]MBB4249071.1 citrate/tricarballylate utilization protein [Rhodocyclus tenuis]
MKRESSLPTPLPPREQTLAALIDEARRTLALCNVCGYCTGYCDVFAAAERRPALTAGELAHLAHLCHNCRSCYYACQYAPPHAFAINVPATLARLRAADYRARAWPAAPSVAALSALVLACLLGVPLLVLLSVPADTLFAVHRGPGAFYAVVPWPQMSGVAALAFGGAALLIGIGALRFWRQSAGSAPPATNTTAATLAALPRALADIATLRNLDGGGTGCHEREDASARGRRHAHHALFYGFLLCLASTASGAFQHHFLGQPAPYPVLSAPVILGSLGGVAMLAGIAGLVRRKRSADPAPTASETEPANRLLLATLAATAASGLALLALRDTPAMGMSLALHLGSVLGLALSMPYGKFVHGAYRGLALLRQAREDRQLTARRRR